MPIATCPNCQVRIAFMDHAGGDFVHQCRSGNAVLDEEDVLTIGDWTDYTGSDLNVERAKSSITAAENTLQGTRASIEGGRNFDRTNEGRNSKLYRQRAHLEYIDTNIIRKK